MNEVFVIGKVESKIEFKFIIKSKSKFSKIEFNIKVGKQKIKIVGYNEKADYALKNIKEKDLIFINGKLNSEGMIEIKWICKI